MIVIFNVIFMSSCVSLISAGYSYSNVSEWTTEYPLCNGSLQSPIDVSYDLLDEFDFNADRKPLKHENIYETIPEKMILENDGHTIKLLFKWPQDPRLLPYIHGGPLTGEYIRHSHQFRWGPDVRNGSEHQLDGASYAMEMQAVHYNRDYGSYEEAKGLENGIMIMSIFFRLRKESKFLAKIIEKLPEVSQPALITEIEPFALGEYFHHDNTTTYVFYPGSLTHPPCIEPVTWIISEKIYSASEEQVRAFQQVNLVDDDDHNNRPLQPINGRKGQFTEVSPDEK